MKYVASIWLGLLKEDKGGEKAKVYIKIINAETDEQAGKVAERVRNELAEKWGASMSNVSLKRYTEDEPILVDEIWA